MPKAEKVERVAALKERIRNSEALLLTEYRGLSVHDATELRRSLSDAGARFSVVKNTLMKRAAEDAGLAALADIIEGPTAVAFVSGDAVATAKRLADAAKKFPALVLRGAWVEGRLLSGEEATRLATLESREVMLSKVAGMLKSELSRAAYGFQALQSRFLSLLEAYKDKLPGEEAPAPEAPAPEEAAPEEAAPEEAVEASSAAEGEAPPAAEGSVPEEAEATSDEERKE